MNTKTLTGNELVCLIFSQDPAVALISQVLDTLFTDELDVLLQMCMLRVLK